MATRHFTENYNTHTHKQTHGGGTENTLVLLQDSSQALTQNQGLFANLSDMPIGTACMLLQQIDIWVISSWRPACTSRSSGDSVLFYRGGTRVLFLG